MSAQRDIQTVLTQAREAALDLSSAAGEALEGRCLLTKSACERLHFSACRSRLPERVCTNNPLTPAECVGSSCGSVQDFSNPVGKCVRAAGFSAPRSQPFLSYVEGDIFAKASVLQRGTYIQEGLSLRAFRVNVETPRLVLETTDSLCVA